MIKTLQKKWATLLLLFVVTGGLTFVFCTFFMVPKYQSVAVIFPPNTHANIHLVSSGIRFGYDKEIGEHLEIMNANDVKAAVIEKYNLLSHYKIDTTSPYFKEALLNKYNRQITLSRTVNKSIHITVKDVDPVLAANIANDIVVISDEHKSELVKKNIALAMNSAKQAYLKKKVEVTAMADSLENLRKAGESVWTFGEERKSGKYQNYELQYRKELERFLNLESKFEELQTLFTDPIPKAYLVSKAQVSAKPVFPNKGLLSMLAASIAVFFYMILLRIKI